MEAAKNSRQTVRGRSRERGVGPREGGRRACQGRAGSAEGAPLVFLCLHLVTRTRCAPSLAPVSHWQPPLPPPWAAGHDAALAGGRAGGRAAAKPSCLVSSFGHSAAQRNRAQSPGDAAAGGALSEAEPGGRTWGCRASPRSLQVLGVAGRGGADGELQGWGQLRDPGGLFPHGASHPPTSPHCFSTCASKALLSGPGLRQTPRPHTHPEPASQTGGPAVRGSESCHRAP